ncbi:MAG: RodZ domain-containing protein [Sphingomonadaceae bacterium]
MDESVQIDEKDASQLCAGDMLREARKAEGLDIAQVAAETRIPQRHLIAIESGEYGKLPSRTYAVGFSRSYARLLGLDEGVVLERLRDELAEGESDGQLRHDKFEPGDPARVPSRGLVWFSVVAVVLLVAGAFTFYRTYFSPAITPPPLTADAVAPAGPVVQQAAGPAPDSPSAALAANGPVVFTSLMDGTWVKFYDGDGKRLYEAQMAKGESYTVPTDAKDPQVWTGRPYALSITVGGRPVPKLSEDDVVVKDVSVSPQALLARNEPVAGAQGASAAPNAAQPTQGST